MPTMSQRPQVELCCGQQILHANNVCMPLPQILGILHGTRLHLAVVAYLAISQSLSHFTPLLEKVNLR
jgi:hypothetical protein